MGRAAEYPYGSAYLRARGRVPPWLAPSWTDARLARVRRVDPGATYLSLWGGGASGSEQDLVDARLRRPMRERDDLDDLVGAAPERVQRWMQAKARLANGGAAHLPLVDPSTVDDVLRVAKASLGPRQRSQRRGPSLDLWPLARAGLLRDLAGRTHDELASRLGVTTTLVGRQLTRHRGLLAEPGYAARLGVLGSQCLDRAHPASRYANTPRLSTARREGGTC